MPTLLHSADIHLDSPLRGLSAEGDAPVDELRGATRGALELLVDLAVGEQVDCLVIAGDLYDGERDDFDTAVFLQRQLARLVDSGVEVVVGYGNHDAASEITRRLRPPPGVHVLAHDRPETVVLEDRGLALHGQSYPQRAVLDDLSVAYPDPIPGLCNIGVLHTALDGRPGHDRYAPCTLGGLAASGYDYWALGHVHQRDVLDVDGRFAVFPGNLQGRHARETGPKGATLVHVEGHAVAGLEHRDLDVVRWVRVAVDATGVGGDEELCSRVAGAVADLPDAGGRLCALRVVVEGATDAADRLRAERARWVTQLRADLAGSTGRLWLEQVDLRCRRPQLAPATDSDAIAAVRSFLADLAGDAGGREELARIFDPLRSRLGADLSALAGAGDPGLDGDGVAALLPEVEAMLLAELGRA